MKYSLENGVKHKHSWLNWLLIIAVIIAVYVLVGQPAVIIGGL